MKTYTLKKTQATLVTRPGNGVAYSIQALGPHGPGYRLAGSPVSCRQLEADTGTVYNFESIQKRLTVQTVHRISLPEFLAQTNVSSLTGSSADCNRHNITGISDTNVHD